MSRTPRALGQGHSTTPVPTLNITTLIRTNSHRIRGRDIFEGSRFQEVNCPFQIPCCSNTQQVAPRGFERRRGLLGLHINLFQEKVGHLCLTPGLTSSGGHKKQNKEWMVSRHQPLKHLANSHQPAGRHHKIVRPKRYNI